MDDDSYSTYTSNYGTKTHADETKGRESIVLSTIEIDENSTGVLENGAFELLAPDGYRFRNELSDGQ